MVDRQAALRLATSQEGAGQTHSPSGPGVHITPWGLGSLGLADLPLVKSEAKVGALSSFCL